MAIIALFRCYTERGDKKQTRKLESHERALESSSSARSPVVYTWQERGDTFSFLRPSPHVTEHFLKMPKEREKNKKRRERERKGSQLPISAEKMDCGKMPSSHRSIGFYDG